MRQNRVEWVALVVSIVAIAAVVVFLAVDAVSDDGRPPQPEVTLDAGDGYRTAVGWVQPALARNLGDEPAESIVFRATATVGSASETSDVTIDFLAAGSETRLFFGFSAQPSAEVSVQVVGFRAP